MSRTMRGIGVWILVGVIGWGGVAWLGWTLWNQDPPRAGFDLALLLEGARAVGAGESPYDPGMLVGEAPEAPELFYSYPPPVAQAMQLVAWLPNGVVLVLWALGATAGLGHIGAEIARRTGMGEPRSSLVGLKAMLAAPLFLPFAVAILFGNLDAWYPLAYGALLLTVLASPGPLTLAGGGAAIAIVAIAKLHPASLLLWVAARAVTERGGPQARVLAAATATGLGIVAASVAIGGIDIWRDYAGVVRAGAGADLVDPRNLGPVSLLAQLTGMEGDSLRIAQAVVSLAAAGVTIVAALRVRDPVASLAVAFAASIITLPVTWYHYPVALIPVGLALAIARPGTRPLVALTIVVAGVAIGYPPLLWLAVGILLVAAFRRSAPSTSDAPVVAPV